MVIYKNDEITVTFDNGLVSIIAEGGSYLFIFRNRNKFYFLKKFSALSRLFRLQECTVCGDSAGKNIVIFYNKQIVHFNLATKEYSLIEVKFLGRTPLYGGACIVGDMLYFGEYFSNKKRVPASIFKINLHTHQIEKIALQGKFSCRHVHGVFFDRYSEHFFICTGDDNQESKIIIFQDFSIKSFEVLRSGSQTYRATSILFDSSAIYWGMDSPEEPAYLIKLCRKSGRVERLVGLPAPIWFLRNLGDDRMIICTTVEPGRGVRTNCASIYVYNKVSSDLILIKSFRKDLLPYIFKFGVIFPIDGADLKSERDFEFNLQGLYSHDSQ